MAGYGQFTTGIVPLPGTPAYEQALRNFLNAQNPNDATAQAQQEALGAFNTLRSNTGVDYGIAQPTIDRMLAGGGGAVGSSSSSSTPGAGAGLLEEILGLIRGTGEKQFNASRDRLNEDYGTARQQKVADLARRGLFRAGVGEKEMQQEIDRPYTRGLSDLEANMADANTDLGLRKAAILGDIEAQARRAAAEKASSMYAQGSATGSGGYNPFSRDGEGSQRLGGSEGEGGIFGATFTNQRRLAAGGGGGGGSSGGKSGGTSGGTSGGAAGGGGQSYSDFMAGGGAQMGGTAVPNEPMPPPMEGGGEFDAPDYGPYGAGYPSVFNGQAQQQPTYGGGQMNLGASGMYGAPRVAMDSRLANKATASFGGGGTSYSGLR